MTGKRAIRTYSNRYIYVSSGSDIGSNNLPTIARIVLSKKKDIVHGVCRTNSCNLRIVACHLADDAVNPIRSQSSI